MLVHIDGHSVIGSGHAMNNIACQDAFGYATNADGWHLAIADGCTGDGKAKTEVGAHLLVKAARGVWEDNGLIGRDPDTIGDDIMWRVMRYSSELKLVLPDLAATLLLAFPENNGVRILMWGDGAFGWKHADKDTHVTTVGWAFNTPPYLVYRHSNEAALNMHIMMDHESGVIRRYPGPVKTLMGIKEGFAGLEWHIPWVDQEGNRLEWLGLFSDGVERVINMEPDEVIHQLMNGPTGGRFAVRALKKMVTEMGSPGDDLSLCCAHFIPETIHD